MVIELRNVGFTNKGAELMLHAIVEKIRQKYPESTFVMSPTPTTGSRPYSKLAANGFFLKSWLWRYGVQWGDFAAFIPAKTRDSYGLILDAEVDIVLDCSGFAYSDGLITKSLKELDSASARWSSRGTKVILLPQALGPFQTIASRKAVKRIAQCCDAIFARDKISFQEVTGIAPSTSNIFLSPDFTILLNGKCPDYFDKVNDRIAVIPNSRMLQNTEPAVALQYEAFMIHCVSLLKSENESPFILAHDNNDIQLAQRLSSRTGVKLLIERDPLALKGILGQCYATIGGRYHGLISALSQGVPSLATTWSHKYRELMLNYEFEEGILSVFEPEQELVRKFSLILNPINNERLRAQLLQQAEKVRLQAEEMWLMIYEILES